MHSDLLIVNKINNTNSVQLGNIHKKLESLNQTATIIDTNFAEIEDSNLYFLQNQLQDSFIRKIRRPFYNKPDDCQFQSVTIRLKYPLQEDRFIEWFNYFASIHKKNIYRIKGVVNFIGNPILCTVQSVGGMVSIIEGPMIIPTEPLESILVFIGKEINKYEIEEELLQFITDAP